MDHSLAESQNYHRPKESQVLEDYQHAIDLLTVNEENRLKKKVNELQSKYDEIGKLVARIDVLERQSGRSS